MLELTAPPPPPSPAVGPGHRQQTGEAHAAAVGTQPHPSRQRAARGLPTAAERQLRRSPAAHRKTLGGRGGATRAPTPPGRTRRACRTARRLGRAGRSLQLAWGHHAGPAPAVDGEPRASPRSRGGNPSSKDQHWAAPTTARSNGRFLWELGGKLLELRLPD